MREWGAWIESLKRPLHHSKRHSVRKIYLGYFVAAFIILVLLQSGLIYLLRIDVLIERVVDDRHTLFFFSTVCLLGSFLLVYYMLRQLFRAIDRLNEATKQVAKGDYTVHLDSDTVIAEIQDVESNFNLMVEELNSVEMLRKNFVADVSHEFKTPLSSITGYITLLQDRELTEHERDECIKMAIFNAEKLNDLTENILRLSRLENQASLPSPTSYRLDEQIREAIVLLEPKWSQKSIQLDIELQDVQFYGCRELLSIVWTNLIGNAIKFSDAGDSIHIYLSSNQKAVRVIVKDFGIGMDKKTQNHMFDKFYQGDTSRKSQGNGLGLALCHEIVSRCGGQILVKSKENEGSTFTVTLPHKSI